MLEIVGALLLAWLFTPKLSVNWGEIIEAWKVS
jgi:hypothetical protein